MTWINKPIGLFGENLAVSYIKRLGYTIIERNFNCKIGEIDIIAKDNGYITFIEVKTRYDDKYGLPCEAVTLRKQHKIYKIAQLYIMKNKLFNISCRFDVIEIKLNRITNEHNIRLIKNAFQI